MANELFGALYGPLLSLSSVKWMNTPQSVFLSSLKLNQLQVAQDAGFFVPGTFISTDPKQLHNFWQKQDGAVITKAIFRGHLSSRENEHTVLFTNRVEEKHMELRNICLRLSFLYNGRYEFRYSQKS